jgi:predicted ATPase
VLSENVASAKLLLLTNYRPEYRHEGGQKIYYTQPRLVPLGKAEAEEFLNELLGEKGSPLPGRKRDRMRVETTALQQLKQLILDKTQGTPFFMEEVVQTLVEDGTLTGAPGQYQLTQHVSTLQLPSSVQTILAARIDRLALEERTLYYSVCFQSQYREVLFVSPFRAQINLIITSNLSAKRQAFSFDTGLSHKPSEGEIS